MSYKRKIKNIDLEKYNHSVVEYYQGWESTDQYAYNILTGYIKSNIHIKNACARYIYDREKRNDLEFRKNEADQIIKFSNKMKHVKGALAGQQIQLQQFQIFILTNINCWYFTKGTRKGLRRFNKAFILVARSNAKSFLASISVAYNMLTSPNGSPQSYSVANNLKQASIVAKDARELIKTADWEISSLFEVRKHDIICPANDGGMRAMSSESDSIDGYRISLGICDELHTYSTSELVDVLVSGCSGTKDSMVLLITTAGYSLTGVAINERNLIRDITSGIVEEDSYFGMEYSIDDDDDYEDPECYIKANPSLGHAVSLSAIMSELARARQSPSSKKSFLTKYMNRFVASGENGFIDVDDMQSNCAKENLNIKDYFGRECSLGLDLAQRFDLAALSFIFPEPDGSITIFQRHYCARGSLKKLTASKYEMYNEFEEAGVLIVTNSNSTDFEYIKDDIRFAAKNFDLKMCGYDPYAGSQLALTLEDEGIEMVEVRQGYAQLSEPSKLFQTLVADHKLKYQAKDKCFEWCCANAVVTEDKNGNIKVHKALDKPHDKVDSIIALITGLNPESLKHPKKKDPYLNRGMITI